MIIFVTGGSGSGKSAYAEGLAVTYGQESTLYYVATMLVYDEEGEKKVHRHRQLRAGKGFHTIEQPYDIGKSVYEMNKKSTVLIECISNLVANEMFSVSVRESKESVEDSVMKGIQRIAYKSDNLIIVSNNVFEDGVCYDQSTMQYIRVLGGINRSIAKMADQVVEVVAGIPIIVKNGV